MGGRQWVQAQVVRGIGWGVRQLIGRADWDRVRRVVADQFGNELTGEQKRAQAVAILHTLEVMAAGFLLNLAIEAAVAWARMGPDSSPD